MIKKTLKKIKRIKNLSSIFFNYYNLKGLIYLIPFLLYFWKRMGFITRKPAILILEDGSIFKGFSLGKIGSATGEICYNTGMTGYQEIYTDPSYFGQIIINTSSHIGNYGTVDNEQESSIPQINGVIINEYSQTYSRFNSDESLEEYFLKK